MVIPQPLQDGFLNGLGATLGCASVVALFGCWVRFKGIPGRGIRQ